ncbi:unnamed protein product, partial [Cuscuta epithymum]
MRKGLLHIMK